MAKHRPEDRFETRFRLPKFRWSRPTWLRAAAINALIAGTVLMSNPAIDQGLRGALLRQAAQIQLMHAMGIIACATFMNMGAATAARAPLLFTLGTIFYCGPAYLFWPEGNWFTVIRAAAILSLAAGWLTLILSASEVDQPENGQPTRNDSAAKHQLPWRVGRAELLGDRLWPVRRRGRSSPIQAQASKPMGEED